MASILQLRDEAFQESAAAHDRMKFELAVFKNEGYKPEQDMVGPANVQVNESLMPQIATGCVRMIPAFREQISEISIESDKNAPTEEDQILIEGLSNWDKMYEEVDNTGAKDRSAIYRNLTVGNNIDKIRWNPERKHVETQGINPCNFAPDPMAQQSNFSDSMYVCQKNWHNMRHMKRHYKDWKPPQKAYNFTTGLMKSASAARHRVDEIWMRRDVAEDCGIDVSGTKRKLIVVKLIDDILYKATGAPYWYPEFPYIHWRNFLDLQAEGKNHAFWGYGYGTLCWTQQKMLDEFLANYILILRNLGIGRVFAEDGVIDEDQMTRMWGAIIRLNEGKHIGQVQHIPPEQVPPEIVHFITFITTTLTEMMPSLSQVFSGEAPYAGASGRAVASLQFANFNQLSDNIREMNEARERRKRIRLALAQQFARKPNEPHLWRSGLDMQVPFPEEARHIGFRVTQPDLTQLPNTPVARMEMLNQMAAMGYVAKNPLELLGLTKGYGWTIEDFIQAPLQPQSTGKPMHTGAASGTEPSMPVER